MEHIGGFYDWSVGWLGRLGLDRARRRLVAGVPGPVLEIGLGTGLNMPFYDLGAGPVVGIDLDDGALRRARRRVGATPLACADAQALPFRDGAFGGVVVGLVLCSVDDPLRALRELRRVLRPGGELRLLEHVRAQGRILGWLQDALAPLWLSFTGGCRLNRRTLELLPEAGFELRSRRDSLRGIAAEAVAVRGIEPSRE